MAITDKQWEFLEPLFPEDELAQGRPGRPFRDAREVLDGVMWVLRTGAQWNEMPKKFPPYQTCHRRYQRWVEIGLMEKILSALAEDLRERGKLDLTLGATAPLYRPVSPVRRWGAPRFAGFEPLASALVTRMRWVATLPSDGLSGPRLCLVDTQSAGREIRSFETQRG